MNNEILDNLNYFSELTQRTLSAFHLTGTEDSLNEDIVKINNLLKKSRKRKLISVDKTNNNKFVRYFEDGFSDIVELEHISDECFIELDEEYIRIDEILNKTFTPINSLRLGNEIIQTDFISISKPSEIIFFI